MEKCHPPTAASGMVRGSATMLFPFLPPQRDLRWAMGTGKVKLKQIFVINNSLKEIFIHFPAFPGEHHFGNGATLSLRAYTRVFVYIRLVATVRLIRRRYS